MAAPLAASSALPGGRQTHEAGTVITYQAGWPTNSISWSARYPRRLAVASFQNDYANNVSIIQQHDTAGGDPGRPFGTAATTTQSSHDAPSADDGRGEPQQQSQQGTSSSSSGGQSLYRIGQFQHYYPPTKTAYGPKAAVQLSDERDLFVTTGDYLRLWHLTDVPRDPSDAAQAAESHVGSHPDQAAASQSSTTGGSTEGSSGNAQGATGSASASSSAVPGYVPATHPSLPNVKSEVAHIFKGSQKVEEFCAPITSFDWNVDRPNLLATCSIDTTVTIWDIVAQEESMQLIAHDRDVFDVAFATGEHIFASAGADGSVRVFDLRNLQSCVIVYESPEMKPMLRVAWNHHESNYLAVCSAEGSQVSVIDTRYPSAIFGSLNQHTAPVNSVIWAPHSSTALCSAGEDKRAIIWDVGNLPESSPTTGYAYESEHEINCAAWGTEGQTDWIAVTSGNDARLLQI